MTNLLFLQSLCPQFDRDNTSLQVSFLASLVFDWVYDVQLLVDLLDKTKSSWTAFHSQRLELNNEIP